VQSVEGMKVICHELTQAADLGSTILEEIIKEANRIVSCLAVMISIHFFSCHIFLLCSHSANFYCCHEFFRFQKPLILAYLGLLQDPANMS
jgi:hypothetical protein